MLNWFTKPIKRMKRDGKLLKKITHRIVKTQPSQSNHKGQTASWN